MTYSRCPQALPTKLSAHKDSAQTLALTDFTRLWRGFWSVRLCSWDDPGSPRKCQPELLGAFTVCPSQHGTTGPRPAFPGAPTEKRLQV